MEVPCNVIKRSDYKISDFVIDQTHLAFDLNPCSTRVTANLYMRKTSESNTLVLDGVGLRLLEITINGEALKVDDYEVDDVSLTIKNIEMDAFVLGTVVDINPSGNKALSGLYLSNGIYCTQCESQGFRRITYYLDRPDVMSVFTVSIKADEAECPVLLSNGDLLETQEQSGHKTVIWKDPYPKPSYLFALVAGRLDYVEDVYQAGTREVLCQVYVEEGKTKQAQFALQSLKKAMKWDEEAYGRYYDLDRYMIVAVSDFNFGAMENKGLNVFNSQYVLAQSDVATDQDFMNVQTVVGHEYFHNWTGNRITLKNWFELSLKEGLTIFREQDFCRDTLLGGLKRIEDARVIREHQFLEDSGPLAHPIRPDEMVEINNFYTLTVYQKGAEVIRMMQRIVGLEVFQKAMALYFERFDGQAVTIDDLLSVMQEVSGKDLSQFVRWFSHAGTPIVHVALSYDEQKQLATLTFRQEHPSNEPFYIPIQLAFLNEKGKPMHVAMHRNGNLVHGNEHCCYLTQMEEVFTFAQVGARPILSLLREFSAPIDLQYDCRLSDLESLVVHDDDPYVRWSALQEIIKQQLKAHLKSSYDGMQRLVDLFHVLLGQEMDLVFKAALFTLPKPLVLLKTVPGANIDDIYAWQNTLLQNVAQAHLAQWMDEISSISPKAPYQFSREDMALRQWRAVCYRYIVTIEAERAAIYEQVYKLYQDSDNLTDRMIALEIMLKGDFDAALEVMQVFYKEYRGEANLINKWFACLVRYVPEQKAKECLKQWMRMDAFNLDNPNTVRSVLGVFSQDNKAFHAMDGEYYVWLANLIKKIDASNPQLGCRLIEPFKLWRLYDGTRQKLLRDQIEDIAQSTQLSKDLKDQVDKLLEAQIIT